jgi:hypothetical protein
MKRVPGRRVALTRSIGDVHAGWALLKQARLDAFFPSPQ